MVINLKNFDNDAFHNEIKNIKEMNENLREDINDLVFMDKEEAIVMLENVKNNLKNIYQNIKNLKTED